jgi:YbbR domain-containing protein
MLEFLQHHWPLKLLALGLAFSIWVSITTENRIVKDFTVPLEIAPPEDRILSDTPQTTVTVRLSGPERTIRGLDSVGILVRVELEDGASGPRDLPLSRTNLVGVPRGVDLEFINPDRLSVNVDEKIEKQMKVEPTWVGQPPEGFVFYGAKVEPQTLKIEGPASEVQSLDELRTNPIRLDGRTAPFELAVTVVPGNPHVRVIEQSDALSVRVIVDRAPVEMLVDVPVVVVGQSLETAVSPQVLKTVLTAPPSLLKEIRPEMIRAIVDASDFQPRNRPYQAPVRFDFQGVSLDDLARISAKAQDQQKVSVRVFEQELNE